MRKVIENFLELAPIWKVYIFGWFSTGAFLSILFLVFDLLEPGTGLNIQKSLSIGAMSGVLFGLMFALMISMSRSSQRFWAYAKEVESAIDAASSKEELEDIYDNQFHKLRAKSQGGPHVNEVNRIYTIIKTKHKYIQS